MENLRRYLGTEIKREKIIIGDKSTKRNLQNISRLINMKI